MLSLFFTFITAILVLIGWGRSIYPTPFVIQMCCLSQWLIALLLRGVNFVTLIYSSKFKTLNENIK